MADADNAFGPFVLDPVRGQLLRDGKVVPVGQRGLVLLQVLIEAGGQAVSKADLMDRAWPGTVVEEGNLTVQIAALRKCLGTAPEGQTWIVTVPRVGYRLLSGRAEPAVDGTGPPALAVLPFENLGGDDEGDQFADGVVSDIITALARFSSIAVLSRNSSAVYRGRVVDVRQVAAELGVRYVLEGSVRRAGERLRIAAQLVDGSTGAHLWAENFDGSVADVFDFQDRITRSVATVVAPRITATEIARSRRERPGSVAAYDIYLQALAKISTETVRDNSDAYALLTEAIAQEPENALFLTHAAWAIEHRSAMGWPPFGPDDREKCAELARRGLEHAAGDAMVMARCGTSLLQGAREYDWGMAVLRSAVAANPDNVMVVVQAGTGELHCGSLDAALGYFHRADRLNPGDPGAQFSLCGIAHVHLIRGNFIEALDWAARALAVNPNFDASLWMLIAANAHLGRMDEARRCLEDLRRLNPGVTISRIRAGQPDKDPTRVFALLEGLRLAGLEEGYGVNQ